MKMPVLLSTQAFALQIERNPYRLRGILLGRMGRFWALKDFGRRGMIPSFGFQGKEYSPSGEVVQSRLFSVGFVMYEIGIKTCSPY